MPQVKNLYVQGTVPKNIMIQIKTDPFKRVKNFYVNDTLVWKNSDIFKFVTALDPSATYDENTLLFVNFGNEFNGEYKTVEDESEIDTTDNGQMYEVKKDE